MEISKNKSNQIEVLIIDDDLAFIQLLKIRISNILNETNFQICNSLGEAEELLKTQSDKTTEFDLVIIDEATQCDIASSLPILQRGKAAVIVGDPKQLKHISFLSTKQQQYLIQENQLDKLPFQQLDYRNKSILDLVSAILPS